MADQPEEKPTNTPDYGCHTNPFPATPEPAPAKKGAADPAPEAEKE